MVGRRLLLLLLSRLGTPLLAFFFPVAFLAPPATFFAGVPLTGLGTRALSSLLRGVFVLLRKIKKLNDAR